MNQKEESKSPTRARQADTSERYLAFLLGKEQYAIPLLQVKEVIEMTEPTPMPQSAPHFLGVINLRGQVIAVVDLRSKLQVAKSENGPKTAIIILDLDPNLSIGVVVDRVNSVQAFHHEDISATSATRAMDHQFVTGIARKDKRMTLILDIKAALSVPELTAIASSNQNQAA